MDFGQALTALKSGSRVARAGWNGKGMWLMLVSVGEYGMNKRGFGCDAIESMRLLPWVGMKTADGGFVPWLASQTDVLAEDWTVVS